MSLEAVQQLVKPGGPLGVLRSWHEQKRRVRVVTRHACGVRGTAVGLLAAYDKFMNLVLQDVHEQYTVLVKVRHACCM